MERFETKKRKPHNVNHTIYQNGCCNQIIRYTVHSHAKNDVTALNFRYFHANCHSMFRGHGKLHIVLRGRVCTRTTVMMTTAIVWSGPYAY